MNEYTLKLDIFEGPLALLLHLIEKNQIDIYDIPIAEVTGQYIDYLGQLEEFNIDIASEFLVMAATLLQIKSRMLLPRPVQSDDTSEEEGDPRQELVERLLEYRKYKQLAAVMEELSRQRELFFTRKPQEIPDKIFMREENWDINDLLAAFTGLWESMTDNCALIMREHFSIQDKMEDIVYLLERNCGKLEFARTFIRSGSHSEIIASFIALLELIRMKRVIVSQEKSFAPIIIRLRGDMA